MMILKYVQEQSSILSFADIDRPLHLRKLEAIILRLESKKA